MVEIVAEKTRHRVVRPHDEVQHIGRKQRHLVGLAFHDDLRQDRAREVLARLTVADFDGLSALDQLLDFRNDTY